MRHCAFQSIDGGQVQCTACGHVRAATAAVLIRVCSAGPRRIPPLGVRLKTFSRAIVRHAKDLFRRRTKIEQARVLAICHGCDRYDVVKDKCRECGCKLGGRKGWLAKTKWRSEHCPVGKW